MDLNGSEIEKRRVGTVKEAVSFYGGRIGDTGGPSLRKNQMDFSVKPSSRAKETQQAGRDIDQTKESKWAAESELSNAKKTVKDLFSMIDESRSKTKALVVKRNENHDYAQVMRELKFVKQELYKLKLDVASVLEEKSRAEEVIKASRSKVLSSQSTAEELRKQIEEANEDHVLAELARIEALKELRDIEAQREKEQNEHSSKMEIARKKMKEAIDEIDESKELEMKLAVTMSDVDLLQNELKEVREMEEPKDSLLQDVTEELEAAKKELASIRDEGFQFMASIDVIRNELNHVTAETACLKKEEAKVDSNIQNLSTKLLRAKSKLEAVSKAEEKAKSIVTSLSHSLEEIKAETEVARKEKETNTQEVIATKEEVKKTEHEIDMNEERLVSAMEELEMIKKSEAEALEKLKSLTENAMRERALAAKHSSIITISKFEYDYLTDHAAVAEEIADKKVEAARAWIEALKASEKEIVVRTKIVQREIKETQMEEARIEAITRAKLVPKRVSREDFENMPRKREKNSGSYSLQRLVSRKSIKLSNGTMVPVKQAKFQKSASPAGRHVSPFTIKKRRKVIPSLASFFKGKRNPKASCRREKERKQ